MKRITMLLGAGILILSSMVFALVPSEAEGAVPQLINFQGILKDGSGNPVSNGLYFATFRIYDAPSGGAVLWVDTQTVVTSSGLFNAFLGRGTSVPDSVFNDTVRYLGVQVFPDPEMTPRQRLTTSGYSFRSGEWGLSGNNIYRLSGNVGIGTASPTEKLDVAGTVQATAFVGSGASLTDVDTNPADDITSLSGGSGIAISGAGNSRTINNTGDTNPADDITSLSGGSGISVSGAGNSRTISNTGDTNPADDVTTAGGVSITGGLNIATSSGDVGIGTSSPFSKLHVSGGDIGFDTTAAYGIRWVSSTGTVRAHLFRWWSDSRLYVTNNGINNLTGVYLAYGATSWTSTSDRRLKENIKETAYGLNTLLRMPVREYNLKGSNEKKIGFVAQEIYPILPEIVSKGDEGEFTATSSPWGINYTELTPILVKAIQEQQQQIEELKALVQKLSAEKK